MAHWRDREINQDHPHGTDYWYRRGCKCTSCSDWRHTNYEATSGFYKTKRAMAGKDVFVPAAPSVRRLRALARIGWSANCIATRTGFSEIHVSRTRRGVNGPGVRVSFDQAIRAVYDELSMTVRDTHHGRKTMTVARRNKWLAPLEVEDELDAA